jgi:protein-S-isoprenylcysteine O-methyltransferase Ste14
MWSIAGLGPRLSIAAGPKYLTVAALVAAGLAFSLLGIMAFRASRTTVNPLNPERASALVTGGVYRITRNPMYVGMAFVLLAWAVNLASVLPFLGVVVFVLYITRLQIVPEERVLKDLFGDAYSRYAARVRRWL